MSLIMFTLTITLSCKITVIKTATYRLVCAYYINVLFCAKTLSRSDNSAVYLEVKSSIPMFSPIDIALNLTCTTIV